MILIQSSLEKATVVEHRNGSGISDNLACGEWLHWEVGYSARTKSNKCSFVSTLRQLSLE